MRVCVCWFARSDFPPHINKDLNACTCFWKRARASFFLKFCEIRPTFFSAVFHQKMAMKWKSKNGKLLREHDGPSHLTKGEQKVSFGRSKGLHFCVI